MTSAQGSGGTPPRDSDDDTQSLAVVPAASARSAAPDPRSAGPGEPPADVGGADTSVRRPAPPRPTTSRPAAQRPAPPRPAARSRRARLALQRIDPWSVFLFTLVASLFLGVALVVAVAALYAILSSLGVLTSINDLYVEVIGGDDTTPLFTVQRFLGGAAVLAAVNVVLLTLLATLSALLYNLCTSFTGGIELTLGERDG